MDYEISDTNKMMYLMTSRVSISWTAKSSDLTPLDLFLYNDVVYCNPLITQKGNYIINLYVNNIVSNTYTTENLIANHATLAYKTT